MTLPPPAVLRTYQTSIVQDIRQLLAEHQSLLCTAPTGSGKTVMLSDIMAQAFARQLPTALLVHRQELVRQSERTITQQCQQVPGVVWQDRREWESPLLILAQDTISNLEIPDIPRIHLLIIDEAHHTAAPGWMNTIARLNPRYLLGFSATPFRHDKEPLCPTPFAKVIRPITPSELISAGYLCPAIIESPIILDHDGQPQPINQASNLVNIYRQAVAYAVANGRTKILIYVSGTKNKTPLEIIKLTTEALRKDGITADQISQNTSTKQREAAFNRFSNAPAASALINYIALTEGTDLPYVDCVIIGRHTTSESTIIQMIGRGLRTHPHKENCLILDFTGRSDMTDIIHYWRIDEAKELGAYTPKQAEKPLNNTELSELITNFPKTLSPIDTTRATYPWFRPYDNRPLLALPIWTAKGQPAVYVAVEPSKRGFWKVSQVTLNNSGPSPLTRQQSVVASAENAATMIKIALGENAPFVERGAPWRLRPASDAQKEAWTKLHPGPTPQQSNLTAGEVSDAIAKKRFQLRVNPTLL